MIKNLHQQLIARETPIRIHLIGVAGSGMSGLARLLLEMGHHVSGSDRVTSGETESLRQSGLDFSSPHSSEAVQNSQAVVYSSAIRPENPALAEARRLGIPTYRRAECLAALLHTKQGIIVSGTHGKTTTSSMTTHLLRKGGLTPAHYVGAEIPVLVTNASWNPDGKYFVAEGDESDGTLALYNPQHSIILNMEEEHLDHYKDITEIRAVFQKLINQTTGAIVFCAEDQNATDLCSDDEKNISYGWENAHWTATSVSEHRGSSTFTVFYKNAEMGRVELGIPGRHNILNALGAIALGHLCGVDFQLMARALSSFAGAKRRFETLHLTSRHRLIDDYGHHPTEIAATLQTARSLQPKRLVVHFQPHRFSRTQRLADDFGKALQNADVVYISSVYAASEDPIEGISGNTIAQAVIKHGHPNVTYLPDQENAHHLIGNQLQEGDLFLTLGAGNIHEVGKKIIRDLKVIDEIRADTGVEALKLYEPMKRHTTLLVGGPAQFWIEPSTFDGFAKSITYCKDRGIPVRVIGRGSNLLVRDGGIRGAVIHPAGGEFDDLRVQGNTIIAGAGVRLKKIALRAQAAGLGGFEWMEGIPGNLGGALRMNAGAMGTETFDQIIDLILLDEHGNIVTRQRGDIEANYRSAPEFRRNYALQATLKGQPATPEEIQKGLDESKNKRRNSQPLAASAGCIFKNPGPIGAGQLIDELGLKDHQIGKAQVSQEHGNFIVNRRQATARNVLDLIEHIKSVAKNERDIDLETEVQILGEDNPVF